MSRHRCLRTKNARGAAGGGEGERGVRRWWWNWWTRRQLAAAAAAPRERGSGCQRLCIKNQSRKMVNSKFRHPHESVARVASAVLVPPLGAWPASSQTTAEAVEAELAAESRRGASVAQQHRKKNAPWQPCRRPRYGCGGRTARALASASIVWLVAGWHSREMLALEKARDRVTDWDTFAAFDVMGIVLAASRVRRGALHLCACHTFSQTFSGSSGLSGLHTSLISHISRKV